MLKGVQLLGWCVCPHNVYVAPCKHVTTHSHVLRSHPINMLSHRSIQPRPQKSVTMTISHKTTPTRNGGHSIEFTLAGALLGTATNKLSIGCPNHFKLPIIVYIVR